MLYRWCRKWCRKPTAKKYDANNPQQAEIAPKNKKRKSKFRKAARVNKEVPVKTEIPLPEINEDE